MVAVNVVAITGGQVIAYAIDAAFQHMDGGWRWMVGLGTVPAGVQFILLMFLPESRRYMPCFQGTHAHSRMPPARILIRTGKPEKARRILSRIYSLAPPQQIELKVRGIPQLLLSLILLCPVAESVGSCSEAERLHYQLDNLPATTEVCLSRACASARPKLVSSSRLRATQLTPCHQSLLAASRRSNNYVDSTR